MSPNISQGSRAKGEKKALVSSSAPVLSSVVTIARYCVLELLLNL